MAIYNPIRDTSPANPAGVSGDSASYVFGLAFSVSSICQINGVWWWVPTGQYNNSAADEQIALWTVNGTHSGVYVAGSVANAQSPYTTNAWNLILFNSPISLAPGTEYMVQKGVSSQTGSTNYSATGFFFGSGAGTNGFSEGPALVYSGLLSDGATSNREPTSSGQMTFFVGSTSSHPPNVTTTFINNAFDSTWYGMDIQIQTLSTITTYGMRLS